MNRKDIYSALGLTLKKFINEKEYPSIDTGMLTKKNCDEIRNHLYGLSPKEDKFKEQILHLLSKGIIEEIREKENYYTFLLIIKFKAENYLVELRLTDNYQWSFISMHYVGEESKAKTFKVMGTVLVAILLLLTFTFIKMDIYSVAAAKLFPVDQQENQEQKQKVTSTSQADVSTNEQNEKLDGTKLDLNVLKDAAKEQNYALIPISEYKELSSTVNKLQENQDKLSKELKDANQKLEANTQKSLEEQPPTKVTITIKPGMQASEIADVLYSAGLGRSKKELSQLFAELDIHNKIRAGTFEIPSNVTYFEMIKIVTRGK